MGGFQHSKNSVKIGINSLNWDNLKCQFLVSNHKKTCYNKDQFVSLAFWVLIQRQFQRRMFVYITIYVFWKLKSMSIPLRDSSPSEEKNKMYFKSFWSFTNVSNSSWEIQDRNYGFFSIFFSILLSCIPIP